MASFNRITLLTNLTRKWLSINPKSLPITSVSHRNSSHILQKENPEEKVVMADNGATIVCWHPAPKFPYECSLPLPSTSETQDVDRVLRASFDDIRDEFELIKPEFQREYLQKVTSTTKHRWFPKNRKRVAKKTKPDRDYL